MFIRKPLPPVNLRYTSRMPVTAGLTVTVVVVHVCQPPVALTGLVAMSVPLVGPPQQNSMLPPLTLRNRFRLSSWLLNQPRKPVIVSLAAAVAERRFTAGIRRPASASASRLPTRRKRSASLMPRTRRSANLAILNLQLAKAYAMAEHIETGLLFRSICLGFAWGNPLPFTK